MSLRDQIEAAKRTGSHLFALRTQREQKIKNEAETLARATAFTRAEAILNGLPDRVREHGERGHTDALVVCSVGSASSLEEIRADKFNFASYVVDRLEAAGFKLSIGIDLSGNWASNNELILHL